MNTLDFLRAVWPANGIYAIAIPFKTAEMKTSVYMHKVFDDIEAAADFAQKCRLDKDVFFGVHTLKEPKVWNPSKVDRKTGELGAFEVRVQSNMDAARCFFFDLDVGTKAGKYPTQAAAVSDLIRFCNETKLPKPLLTSSGGGVHVYWLLTDPLPSVEWKQHANRLKYLAKHHGLLADPARTTDTASVLRVAGTLNLKDRSNPRKVKVLVDSPATPNTQFLKRMGDAITRAGLTIRDAPTLPPDVSSPFGSNLAEPVEFDGPPVGFGALITACEQVRRYLRAKGDVSEPEWYHMLNLVRFCDDGHAVAHKISAPHPDYVQDDTDAKLQQLEDKGIKPTSCYKLAEVGGDEGCAKCPFAGKVKTPLVAARFKETAKPPIVQHVVGTTTTTLTVPDAPFPYKRLKDGRIVRVSTNKDGDEINLEILSHDLHPLRRVRNTQERLEQHMWRTTLPRQGAHDFALDADALYDRKKFVTSMSNEGVYPDPANLEHLQAFMVAYISKLQQEADAEAQCNHLGWLDEGQTQFIMPDKILLPDGTAKPAMLSLGAERATAHVHRKGTLERQVDLLGFYNDPAYAANQFFIMASLGAPLFFATGQHGVILNASGDPGASKSTSLYAGASMWGDPALYPINGTNGGATTRARNERITTLANLPIMVDEITHLASKDATDMAMGITQPGHRIRLDNRGVERASNGGYKATIMLCTANSSLHTLLSADNAAGTAGSMRVFEMVFKKLGVHTKVEADAFLNELKQNYGHIGDAFMAHFVQHRDAIVARVQAEMARLDIECVIQPGERFWSAAMAAALVAGQVAFEIGLLPYNVALVRDWLVRKQMAHMRGIVNESYVTPLGQLMDYLETINAKMIILGPQFQNNEFANIVQHPVGELLAHYDQPDRQMFVLRKGFMDYCRKTGANHLRIWQELSEQGVVTNARIRKTLGAGTEHAKGQTYCFQINMSHPDVAGKEPELAVKVETKLRVVEGGKA